MFEEIKAVAEELVSKVEGLKATVANAENAAATDINKTIVEAVVGVLEAQGYTVTPPAAA